MQEVITKTIIILAAMVAVILIFNRFGRKKNKGCRCGCGENAETVCGDCPQASCCGETQNPNKKMPEA